MNMTPASEKNIANIAHHLVMNKERIGLTKKFCKDNNLDVIRSIGTSNTYYEFIKQYIRWRAAICLPLDGPYQNYDQQQFLYEMDEIWQQKQLNGCRAALQTVFGSKLEMVISDRVTDLKSRSCSKEIVNTIISRQIEKNKIATRLCNESGLRAHELFTIRRANEMQQTPGRSWRNDLFANFGPHKIYAVKGKGGLCRYVAIPDDLAEELEKYRLEFPKTVKDRGIKYERYYDIGGGQALSQSYSAISLRHIGVSMGLHGLRHNYAQRRLEQLRAGGLSPKDAMLILSQELGHFRPEITLTYLR